METHYETLEVSPNASTEVIQAAFAIVSARQTDPSGIAACQKALDTLTDPAARDRYDRSIGCSALENEFQKANELVRVWRNGEGWVNVELTDRFGGSHLEANSRRRTRFPGISSAYVPAIYGKVVERWKEDRAKGGLRAK